MKLIIHLPAPRFLDVRKLFGPQLPCLRAAHVTEVMVVFDGYEASSIEKSFFEDVGLILGFKISYYAGEESSFSWQWWEKVKKWLTEGEENKSFVLMRGDIVRDLLQLSKMVDFHERHGRMATMFLVKAVLPPTLPQELVISNDETGLVEDMKKVLPQSFVAPKVDASFYLFNLSLLETPTVIFSNSLEDVLRYLVNQQELYSIVTDAPWIDFKARKRNVIIKKMGGLEERPFKVGHDVHIDETATIGADCYIGPSVVIGPNCVVENNVRLKHCALMNGVTVKKAAFVNHSRIASGSVVGRWTHISRVDIGREVKVRDEIVLEDVVSLWNSGNVTSNAFNAIVVPQPPPN